MRNGMRFLAVLPAVFLFTFSAIAQLDSIVDQGVYRTFIVHTPTGYTPSHDYPLVFNLHGFNSNAAQQQGYSQFDNVADTAGFIVVYPNAVNESWNFMDNGDANFISHLIDTIRNRYSCNNCLFFTGISMGGFMAYRLTCVLPQPITAVAVVSGNMLQLWQNTCSIPDGLPIMHFHGTEDPIVNYNGTIGIPPVETTVQWWVSENHCNTTPVVTPIPNIHPDDNCTVEKYYYGGGLNGSEVTFYKITNGGHTWPGAIPAPPLGNTDQDISASYLIGAFFERYCVSTVDVQDRYSDIQWSVFPNPAYTSFEVVLPQTDLELTLYDSFGRRVWQQKVSEERITVDCAGFAPGMYFLTILDGGRVACKKVFIKT